MLNFRGERQMKKENKSPYRILRLRSGDDIITKIVGKKGDKFILERPMQMKSATIFDGVSQKEILCFRNWLQYTNDNQTDIPSDWVATFLTPQEEISDLYEHEKRKEDRLYKEMERLTNAEPEDKLEVLSNIMQMMKESKEEKLLPEETNPQPNIKDMIEPGSIIVNLAIPPFVFFEMISSGILEDFDIEHMLGDAMGYDENETTISDIDTSDEKNREDYGSKWTDWSQNVRDYLDDD